MDEIRDVPNQEAEPVVGQRSAQYLVGQRSGDSLQYAQSLTESFALQRVLEVEEPHFIHTHLIPEPRRPPSRLWLGRSPAGGGSPNSLHKHKSLTLA